jgi:hypothetical protein
MLAVGGAQLPCSAAGYSAIRTFETRAMADTSPVVDARRWTALVGLHGVLLAQGRDSMAVAIVDSSIAAGEGGTALLLVGAPLSPVIARSAAAVVGQLEARWGPRCAQCTSAERIWQLAIAKAHAGDGPALAEMAERAAARARASGTAGDSLIARSVAAWAALARGDSSRALADFAAVLARPVPSGSELTWTHWAPRDAERLAYARLLAARRDFRRAIEVANVFDSPTAQGAVPYVRPSLVLRAEAADALGDGVGAQRFRARLATLTAVPGMGRRE